MSLHSSLPSAAYPLEIPVPQQSGSPQLGNPIFHSLLTAHSRHALTHGQVRRFPAEIGPLSGMPDQSNDSYDHLHALAGSGGITVLFLEEPPAPPVGWKLLRGGMLDQMICFAPERAATSLLPLEAEIRPLTAADARAMVDLARLTEPGPFELRTLELGTFFGVFHGCRLMAMAGQRLSLPGFIEVSAVCTHPDARGRGYAATLMSAVMADIAARGQTPILHTLPGNATAIAVYKKLGFAFSRSLHLAVLQSES
jgi:GNAT superfamily N-acetyltransferase